MADHPSSSFSSSCKILCQIIQPAARKLTYYIKGILDSASIFAPAGISHCIAPETGNLGGEVLFNANKIRRAAMSML